MSRTFRLVKVGIVLAMVVLLPVGVAPVVANEEDDSLVALGEALFYDPATDSASGGGLILGGSLTFTSAATTAGAPIVGSMTGEVFEL